ncbi:MAG TPA: flagellar export protein FliJ [Burkholderiales bacterium]|nr:flagellar export protein FliJ [Burkholderiales bacterium]
MRRDPAQTLVDLSKSREEDALRRFSALLRQCGSAEDKLALLERYRREYADRLAGQGRAGITTLTLENFKQFMTNLEGAVQQQQNQAERSRQALDDGLAALEQARRRSKIFEMLVEKRRSAAKIREGRRQQAQEDEFAARAHARNK